MKDALDILKHPLATEKAVRLMEAENKLIFIVDKKATKADVKRAFQEAFKAKVLKVNTSILPSGKKKAYVSLSPETPARDIATQIGMH